MEMWEDSKERPIGQKELHSFENHAHFLHHILHKQFHIDIGLMDEKVVGMIAYWQLLFLCYYKGRFVEAIIY